MPLAIRRPVRMNNCEVSVRLFGRGVHSEVDPDYREVADNRVYRDVTLTGQLVGARSFFRLDRRQTGDVNPSVGAMVFRPEELAKKNVALNKGDKIIRVAKVATDFQITKVSPMAPWKGGTLLISVEFEQSRKTTESV